ncbi:MAG: C39 family peptidase [Patescibacteria group bacterium]
MKLDIPYYSQQRDVADEFWQVRACGILCLKMVVDFYGVRTLSPDEFLKLALAKGAYHNPNGWLHNKQIEIAADFGLMAFRKEFGRVSAKNLIGREDAFSANCRAGEGLNYLRNFLEQERPVIVSVAKKFKYPDKFHQVVLTGFENNEAGEITGFYYNDSDYQNETRGKNLFVSIKLFKQYWRGMAIFVVSRSVA